MFDTQYNVKGMGCGCTASRPRLAGLGALGSCGSERAERERRSNYRDDLKNNSIPNTRNQLNALKTGVDMQQYHALNERIDKIRNLIGELKTQKAQAMKIRDMWRENPEVAAQSGLGGWFTRMFSCGHYEQDIKEINEEIGNLESELGNLNGELATLQKMLSPQNMGAIQQTATDLTAEKDLLEKEIADYKQETENIKTQRNARIEAERLALEQAARDKENAEKKAQEDAAKKKSNTNTILLVGVAVGALLLFRGKKSKTTINVNK